MSFLVPILKIREQRREASSPYFSWAQYIIFVMWNALLILLNINQCVLAEIKINESLFSKLHVELLSHKNRLHKNLVLQLTLSYAATPPKLVDCEKGNAKRETVDRLVCST